MSFTKFSTAFARALHESGLSYNAIDSTQVTSASVFSAPSGWNTGSKLPLRERRKPTQNYYLRVVLRWLRRLVLDTREHALGATSCQHPNLQELQDTTFQTARFPTNLGNRSSTFHIDTHLFSLNIQRRIFRYNLLTELRCFMNCYWQRIGYNLPNLSLQSMKLTKTHMCCV